MTLTIKHYLYLLASLACTVLFLWLFARSADWEVVVSIIHNSHLDLLALAVLALLVDFAIRLKRWHYILQRHHSTLSLSRCITPYFSSFALNNLLPFRLGDVARATLFNRHLGVGIQPVVSSLVLERIADLVSLLLLFLAALVWLAVDTSHPAFAYILGVAALALCAIGVLVGFPEKILAVLKAAGQYCAGRSWKIPATALTFIEGIVESFNMHLGWKSASTLFFMALAAWLFEALSFALVAYSLDIGLGGGESLFVMSTATLSTLMPSTPGYIGTFDYLCKLALVLVGADENSAVAASLLMHITNLAPITLIGVVAFVMYFGRRSVKVLIQRN